MKRSNQLYQQQPNPLRKKIAIKDEKIQQLLNQKKQLR